MTAFREGTPELATFLDRIILVFMHLGLTVLLLLAITGALALEPRRSFILSYGENTSGRLGHDGTGRNVVALRCPRFVCAIREISTTSDYTVVNTFYGAFGWGSNTSGELGNGEIQDYNWQPTKLNFPSFENNRPFTVITLEDSATYISINSTVEAYGSSDANQFGLLNSKLSMMAPASLDSTRNVAASDVEPLAHTLSCAGTRCYFRDKVTRNWGYWGNASYDSAYNPSTTSDEISWIQDFPLSFDWIESSSTTVYFGLQGNGDAIFGKGYFLSRDPNINSPFRRFDAPCTPTPYRKLTAAGDGFFVYSCTDEKRFYSFGANEARQLGNSTVTASYISPLDDHILVEIALDDDETFDRVVAGKSTAYACTSSGNVWVWGYHGNNAAGADIGGANAYFLQPDKTILSSQFETEYFKFQVTDIKATSAAHGVFLVLSMRRGNCNNLPAEVNMPEIFCDYDDFLNFPAELVMTGATKGEMTSFMKMRGDMVMHGTSKMMSMAGMIMEGAVNMYDASEALLTGYGELIGDVKLFNASKLHFSNSNTSLTGNLDVGPLAHLILSDLNATFFDLPAITFNGTAIINGTITITYTQAEIDAMVLSVVNSTTPTSASPDSMEPSAEPLSQSSTSNKKSTILQTTDGSLDASKATVSIQLLQPSGGCSTVSGTPSVEGNNLNVLFTITTDTSCTPSSAVSPDQAAKNAKKSNTTAIIVGSVVGGVVLLAIVATLLILKVAPVRNAILPYREASARRAAATRVQVDAGGE